MKDVGLPRTLSGGIEIQDEMEIQVRMGAQHLWD